MLPFDIRPATPLDKEFVYDVKKEAVLQYFESIDWAEEEQRGSFEENFSVDTCSIIMVMGISVGFVIIQESADSLRITDIYLAPPARNKGIGTGVIEDITDFARWHGKPVYIGCFKANDGARRFIERLGFKILDKTALNYEFILKPTDEE